MDWGQIPSLLADKLGTEQKCWSCVKTPVLVVPEEEPIERKSVSLGHLPSSADPNSIADSCVMG